MHDSEIEFIAKHYRKGRFSIEAGWRRLDIAPSRKWRPFKIAAAITAAVVLTASAALLYHDYRMDSVAPAHEIPVDIDTRPAGTLSEVKVIDFENTPLPEVVERIKEVYGVDVSGVPADAAGYRLSLHYQGEADDLIYVINDILGTDMKIEE